MVDIPEPLLLKAVQAAHNADLSTQQFVSQVVVEALSKLF